MVMIGSGRGDPRAWVQCAYVIITAMEAGSTRDPLPSKPEIARALGVSQGSVTRAYRELDGLGLVRRVPGLGYFTRCGQ